MPLRRIRCLMIYRTASHSALRTRPACDRLDRCLAVRTGVMAKKENPNYVLPAHPRHHLLPWFPATTRRENVHLRGDAHAKQIDDYLQGLRHVGVSELEHAVVPGGEFSPLEAPKEFVATLRGFCRRCDASIGR